ncbi:MAG: tRNA guanosine(34) transglycosylase Tgt [Patescibacteria group bacterium]|jgi:queuine tRNA-ribosyltransferase|nr:tRNA guanosine(34) transglycosylase Tgt [Patescibacteria group bacterium]
MNHFKVNKISKKSKARLASLKTNHGVLKTPFFMPVATQGTIKHVHTDEMRKLKSQILLSNTYHLMLRPGEKLIKKAGGLHGFMNWDKPILTDSGGFQVFSLADTKNKTGDSLVKIHKDGVQFKSYIDGRKFDLTPEKAFQIQKDLGVDIAVCLDECISLPAKKEYIEKSVDMTTEWAKKASVEYKKTKGKKPLLHAVIQGGLEKDLRLKSLRDLVEIGFDGYNIGGLSVGEDPEDMYEVLDYLTPEMPADKPRYLMGVGYPENILHAVKQGIDMFDCVIPSREGRHGRLFYWNAKNRPATAPSGWAGELLARNSREFYKTENIKNSKFEKDFSPISKNSKLSELRNLTKAYLHYLIKIKEPLGARLATLNNLEFYLDFMREIRDAIKNNKI